MSSVYAAKTRTAPSYVYELDKGWSFDGNYIPHFIELNWYYGDSPVQFKTIQKIRIHGLSKGHAGLQVSTNGMETAGAFYLSDYSTPAFVDLPSGPALVTEDFNSVTNYTDAANRGVSIQMKFEGRNTDITLPEPGHVLQALVVQSTPDGTGQRAN